jgi:anaerobic selenocysteine-containing dehydrogenase
VTQAMCTSFKKELFEAVHNFLASGGHTFKCALYTNAATLNEATTVYSSSDEVTSAGYTAGGFTLTNVNPSISGTTAMVTFSANPTWTGVTFTASQALIYNASASNKAVAVLDFGGNHSIVSGDFVLTLPAVLSTTALLRLV